MNDRRAAVTSSAWMATLDGLSVVIPAYDEEQGIALTIHAIHDTFQRAGFTRYETVVVNDGSADGTALEAV